MTHIGTHKHESKPDDFGSRNPFILKKVFQANKYYLYRSKRRKGCGGGDKGRHAWQPRRVQKPSGRRLGSGMICCRWRPVPMSDVSSISVPPSTRPLCIPRQLGTRLLRSLQVASSMLSSDDLYVALVPILPSTMNSGHGRYYQRYPGYI